MYFYTAIHTLLQNNQCNIIGQHPWKDQEGVCVMVHRPQTRSPSKLTYSVRMMFMRTQMRTCFSCYSLEVSFVPWQSDRAEISQCVIHQLQTLRPDQSPQDADEVLQLVRISQVLIRQVQHLGSQRQNRKRNAKITSWLLDRYLDSLGSVRFVFFYAHQVLIYLLKNTIKTGML